MLRLVEKVSLLMNLPKPPVTSTEDQQNSKLNFMDRQGSVGKGWGEASGRERVSAAAKALHGLSEVK